MLHDVRVDYDAMEASRRAYDNMRELLEGSTRSLDGIGAGSVPQHELRRRLEDLHGSWGGGAKKLARFAEDAGAGLQGILEAFQGFDADVAASMDEGTS